MEIKEMAVIWFHRTLTSVQHKKSLTFNRLALYFALSYPSLSEKKGGERHVSCLSRKKMIKNRKNILTNKKKSDKFIKFFP
jgi:hypothetical protein